MRSVHVDVLLGAGGVASGTAMGGAREGAWSMGVLGAVVSSEGGVASEMAE